ncbi:biopolymer transporter ExbD [bacterium]|nr:biopolymer transporter ExbD [bacterium]
MAIKLTQSENGKKATFNEINITPLTDIFLVLLIIMMVIAPGFQSMDNNITMPEINSGVAIEDKKAIVSITKDGEMYINGEKTNEGDLEEKLVALVNESQEKQVVVRADEKTKSSEILKIMRLAQSAGYEKLTVAGEPLSKKEQRNLKENAEKGAKN